MEIKILNEHTITVYPAPDKAQLQQVITYQVPGLAPRTLWIDASKLPDTAYQADNPGKPVPKALQDQADKVRRAAIEADVARIKEQSKVRSI